jgi:hypothetical protein
MSTRLLLIGGYTVVAVLCWSVPPLATLHYPAGVVWAVVAFVGSGAFAVRQFRSSRQSLSRVTRSAVTFLGIPLVGLLMPGLWRTHCDLVAGFGYFLLFPLCSALLAVALAYWLTSRSTRYAVARLLAIGLLIAIAGPVYDIGLHPQFYTYNHVFGGVLAPIYDRFLPFRPGLIAFRATTLLWAVLLVARGYMLRQGRWSAGPAVMAGTAAVALVGAYLYADALRINTSAQRIQQALGAWHATEHFDVHYDAAALDSSTVARIGDDLEFERARLAHDLNAGSEAPTRIQVYLYPDAETRARLTGAHTTSVAPVWLATPQTHLLMQRYGSMPHEMAHLMTRPYGLPIVNASWSVGLVEGWAVALDAPTRRPPPHDQVLAATPPGELDRRAQMVQQRWTPWGFWSAPGGVSYTVFGSFVASVAEAHGHDAIADAYAWGDLPRTTGCTIAALTEQWLSGLRTQPQVDVDARPVAQRRFRIPSFFELDCPYEPIPAQARYEQAQADLGRHDTTAARQTLHAVIDEHPDFTPARRLLAHIYVETQPPDSVTQALGDAEAWGAEDWALFAQSHARHARWNRAAEAYRRADQATSRAAVESRTRHIARALDAAASTMQQPDSTWQKRLQAFEAPLTADTLDVRLHRTRHLDTLRTAEMPRGWRNTWRLRIHLGTVKAARRQRDAAALQEAGCAARAVAKAQNARPLYDALTHEIRRAAWMRTGEPVATCTATDQPEP